MKITKKIVLYILFSFFIISNINAKCAGFEKFFFILCNDGICSDGFQIIQIPTRGCGRRHVLSNKIPDWVIQIVNKLASKNLNNKYSGIYKIQINNGSEDWIRKHIISTTNDPKLWDTISYMNKMNISKISDNTIDINIYKKIWKEREKRELKNFNMQKFIAWIIFFLGISFMGLLSLQYFKKIYNPKAKFVKLSGSIYLILLIQGIVVVFVMLYSGLGMEGDTVTWRGPLDIIGSVSSILLICIYIYELIFLTYVIFKRLIKYKKSH